MTASDLCREIYGAALESVRADRLLRPHFYLLPPGPLWVIGAGKAAAWMVRELADFTDIAGGMIAVKAGHTLPGLPVQQIEAGHPIPDEQSLFAGAEALRIAGSIPEGHSVVGFVTGGASSLMEHLRPPHTLPELQEITRRSMAGGEDIQMLNQRRRSMSLIKGGGLAQAVGSRYLMVYVLSDVIGGSLEIVGSGPFWRDSGEVPHQIIGMWEDAVAAARAAGERLGLRMHASPAPLLERDDKCAAQMIEGVRQLEPGEAMVWGGEPTVEVRGSGSGGRCQQIACRVAKAIRGREDIAFLAAGTDGTDGPTDAAGAVVDGRSYHLAAAKGIELDDVLINSSSFDWCRAAEAHVFTGPTGSNVNDLFLAVRASSR